MWVYICIYVFYDDAKENELAFADPGPELPGPLRLGLGSGPPAVIWGTGTLGGGMAVTGLILIIVTMESMCEFIDAPKSQKRKKSS